MANISTALMGRAVIALSVALLSNAALLGATALAHGKELTIEVSSFAPDAQQPLVRLYQAKVAYAGDLDPVTGASITLTAEREGGGPPMDPIVFQPLNEKGLYAAQVEFPLYGQWTTTLAVSGMGEGETSFVEDVTPPTPTTDPSEVRQQVLELFFNFDWRDVAAIAVRVSHSLGAVALFGMTGVILTAFWFLAPESRPAVFGRLKMIFLPTALLATALLLASGIYTGLFSAPIKAPGVFDVGTMRQIPFGDAYLLAISLKIVGLVGTLVIAFRMAKALAIESVPVPAGGSMATLDEELAAIVHPVNELRHSTLYRLALTNAGLGLLLVGGVVVTIYLHYISHLAVLVPN